MIAKIITILQLEESRRSADRCRRSCLFWGLDKIEFSSAVIPSDDPVKWFAEKNITPQLKRFAEYSRPLNALSAFASHFKIWNECVERGERLIVLEHDAVMIRELPLLITKWPDNIVNLGRPSYGNFRRRHSSGLGELFSKPHLPGAHAYLISPSAASRLIDATKRLGPAPTDVFISKSNFPELMEHYPWIFESWDQFTTIQEHLGLQGKHNLSKGYRQVII